MKGDLVKVALFRLTGIGSSGIVLLGQITPLLGPLLGELQGRRRQIPYQSVVRPPAGASRNPDQAPDRVFGHPHQLGGSNDTAPGIQMVEDRCRFGFRDLELE